MIKKRDQTMTKFPYPELHNAKFFFGGSDEDYLDCLGLVLYSLRDEGWVCDWESKVDRKPQSIEENKRQLTSFGFKQIDYSDIVTEYYDSLVILFTMKQDDPYGHLGVKYEYDSFFHMTYTGIREAREKGVYNVSYWQYQPTECH